jgi:hypothetical protein
MEVLGSLSHTIFEKTVTKTNEEMRQSKKLVNDQQMFHTIELEFKALYS